MLERTRVSLRAERAMGPSGHRLRLAICVSLVVAVLSAYDRQTSPRESRLIRLDSGHGDINGQPPWSPDGRSIAYLHFSKDHREVEFGA
jgi:hypothetical protein